MHLFTKGQYLACYVPAPGFVTSQDMSTSEEGNCAGGEEKDPVPSNVSEEKMKVHRGGRYPYDIQLETLATNNGKDQFRNHALISYDSFDSKAFKVALTCQSFRCQLCFFYSDVHIHKYIIYLFYLRD